ncbi:hypothetical protein C8J56DRAFT_965857, partial [Mycena floridula]
MQNVHEIEIARIKIGLQWTARSARIDKRGSQARRKITTPGPRDDEQMVKAMIRRGRSERQNERPKPKISREGVESTGNKRPREAGDSTRNRRKSHHRIEGANSQLSLSSCLCRLLSKSSPQLSPGLSSPPPTKGQAVQVDSHERPRRILHLRLRQKRANNGKSEGSRMGKGM